MAMRAAPDLVGALDWVGIGDLAQGAQVVVCLADGANAPSGGRSPLGISLRETLPGQRGGARLEAGRGGIC